MPPNKPAAERPVLGYRSGYDEPAPPSFREVLLGLARLATGAGLAIMGLAYIAWIVNAYRSDGFHWGDALTVLLVVFVGIVVFEMVADVFRDAACCLRSQPPEDEEP